MKRYVPRQGDLISITFDHQSGHEQWQWGRRPAFVVSRGLFYLNTGLAIVCLMATTERGNPFMCLFRKRAA